MHDTINQKFTTIIHKNCSHKNVTLDQIRNDSVNKYGQLLFEKYKNHTGFV